MRRVEQEGTTLYAGAPPDPPPTPSPSPTLTYSVHLPLVTGGCGYLIDGRLVPPIKYYLFNGRRIAMRQGYNGPVTYFYHDHPLVAPLHLTEWRPFPAPSAPNDGESYP